MAISEGKYLSETNPAMSILRPLSPIAQTNSAGSNQMPLCMGWVGSSSQLEVASSDGDVVSSDGSVVASDGSVISEEESDTMMGFSSGWVGGVPQT